MPIRSKPIPIIDGPEAMHKSVSTITEPTLLNLHSVAPSLNHEPYGAICPAQSATIPAHTEIWAKVTTNDTGLITVTPHPRTTVRHNFVAANGVADVWSTRQFNILLANCGDFPAFFPKHMPVALATNPPLILLPDGTVSTLPNQSGAERRY